MKKGGMKKIHPLLDREKQQKARRYEKEKRQLSLAGLALSAVVLCVFYYSGLSDFLAWNLPGGSFLLTLALYVVFLDVSFFVLHFPLNFYSGYIHEHKWNFSNQTVKSWLWEKCKSFLVGLVLAWIVLVLLFWIMEAIPGCWWLAAGAGMALFSVVLAALLPVVILPIFNKYTPIEDEELKSALDTILTQGGLRSSGFFKEDMSRQTKKENAFLVGLGKTRRVVLGDNLMANMAVQEIKSILAHEVGHYKHRHVWKGVAAGTVQQLIVFFFVDLLMKAFFPGFLSSSRENLALFPCMAICAGAVSGVLFGPPGNFLSRFFERQADRYAVETLGDSASFVSALAGLANRNLANAYPEKWVKIFYYSHPPIGERLENAGSWTD